MTAIEELSIIEKVKAGDSDAFGVLVVEHQKKVYNFALKMLRNEEDALDISQEAFIKAYTGIQSFRSDSKFSVWLYRLTYNLCIDLLRKKKRENEMSLSYEDDDGEDAELQIPDERISPEREYEKKELRELIGSGLDSLPPDHRQILILREISGLSYCEIADVLELNEGTVKSRIARARRSLADYLMAHGTFCGTLRQNSRKEVNPHD